MLKLYNTLTRKKETFKPINKGEVKMYVCGPTVNDVPHLGHARQQITFDVLRRYLTSQEYKVTFVSNVTDIDDKIINKAHELKEDIKKLVERNTQAHRHDYAEIGVIDPDIQPKATQYVKEMVELISTLEKKGYTYTIDDGVYYDISKFKEYGKLSHQNIENLKQGARIKVKEQKKNKEDFVLWKFSKPGEPSWDSPWGAGRPGWHIECSAMSHALLGLPLDIHGGGQDLMFPHHEDEIAQSEAAYGKKLANYWVHNGMLNVDKVKMSKSLGNFKTIRDILKNYSGNVIRYLVLSTHYRKPSDFSQALLEDASNAYTRLKNIIKDIPHEDSDDARFNEGYLKDFKKAMDDDLNTPKALQVLWKLLRDEKAHGKISTVWKIDEVLGLNLLKKETINIPHEIQTLAHERETARKNKDWKMADKLRDTIKKKGYLIEDTETGPRIIPL
ncbi:cysteine--tRNA ligase [Candidatus Pacearchaeota archaeon]|nr:cysteine--tRNA ligase [Candidatus Pacearchaeota archaeon]